MIPSRITDRISDKESMDGTARVNEHLKSKRCYILKREFRKSSVLSAYRILSLFSV